MSVQLKSHYQETFIRDINESMLRCRLLGKIIDKKDASLLIDDGTGVIEVIVNEDITKIRCSLDIGKDVIVFGKVVIIENAPKVFADIIRDVSQMNLRYYRKIIGGLNESSD